MKRTLPPFLELGFYYSNQKDADAFASLVNTLFLLGATYCGEIAVQRGHCVRSRSFMHLYDEPSERKRVSLTELQDLLVDPDARVTEVLVKDAVGIARKSADIITYNGFYDKQSVAESQHPLVILTEGAIFEGIRSDKERFRAYKAGMTVYYRLVSIISKINPSYASITCESPLLCPTDLRSQPSHLVFNDAYVSFDYINRDTVATTFSSRPSFYYELLSNGVYWSACEMFNPARKSSPLEHAHRFSYEMSKRIGKIHHK